MKIEEFSPLAIKGRDTWPIVTNKDGTQVVTMPDGTVIPAQVWSRVYTSVKEAPYVILKLHVQIK